MPGQQNHGHKCMECGDTWECQDTSCDEVFNTLCMNCCDDDEVDEDEGW